MFELIYLQVRSSWVPSDSLCRVPYVRTNNKTLISMFITDFVLLAIMLLGLFRLRHLGGGTFGLGRLLWKQVRWQWFWNCHISLIPDDVISV